MFYYEFPKITATNFVVEVRHCTATGGAIPRCKSWDILGKMFNKVYGESTESKNGGQANKEGAIRHVTY